MKILKYVSTEIHNSHNNHKVLNDKKHRLSFLHSSSKLSCNQFTFSSVTNENKSDIKQSQQEHSAHANKPEFCMNNNKVMSLFPEFSCATFSYEESRRERRSETTLSSGDHEGHLRKVVERLWSYLRFAKAFWISRVIPFAKSLVEYVLVYSKKIKQPTRRLMNLLFTYLCDIATSSKWKNIFRCLLMVTIISSKVLNYIVRLALHSTQKTMFYLLKFIYLTLQKYQPENITKLQTTISRVSLFLETSVAKSLRQFDGKEYRIANQILKLTVLDIENKSISQTLSVSDDNKTSSTSVLNVSAANQTLEWDSYLLDESYFYTRERHISSSEDEDTRASDISFQSNIEESSLNMSKEPVTMSEYSEESPAFILNKENSPEPLRNEQISWSREPKKIDKERFLTRRPAHLSLSSQRKGLRMTNLVTDEL